MQYVQTPLQGMQHEDIICTDAITRHKMRMQCVQTPLWAM